MIPASFQIRDLTIRPAAVLAPMAGVTDTLFRRVIRGFDRKHGGLIEAAHVTSLDAGSGFGGELLAVCFAADGSVSETLSA